MSSLPGSTMIILTSGAFATVSGTPLNPGGGDYVKCGNLLSLQFQ